MSATAVETTVAELYFPAGQRVHDEGVEINPGQSKHCTPLPRLLAAEYEAMNPLRVDDPSDVNRTLMYPVDDVTGSGKVEPLNGLPGSSVIEEHDNDWHEYTRT